MKIQTFFFLLFYQCLIYSQTDNNHSYYWRQDKNEAIVAVKNCYVRGEANTTSKLLDSIQMGKKITIINNTDVLLNLRGINANWAEIQYFNSRNEVSKGFVWKGFLALDFIKNSNGTFLTRIDKISKKFNKKENYDDTIFQISVVLINENNEISAIKSVEKNLLESAYFQNKCIGALGLENLKEIYRISFSGEACGIPTHYLYFGWNSKELIILPEKMEVGDADVYFHSEKFVFPKEKGGRQNFIFKEIEEAEKTDDNSDWYDITTYKETYSWNGEKVQFVGKTKPKKIRKKLE